MDFSKLGALREIDTLDLAQYPDQKKKFRLPEAGVYTLQAKSEFTEEDFDRSRSGDLYAQIDPTIAEGEHAGFQLKYQRVYNSTYDEGGRKFTWLGSYLRSLGVGGEAKTEKDLIEKVVESAGGTFKAFVNWRAKKGNFEVKGMQNFPQNPDGTYQSWVNHPTETDEKGNPIRVFANLEIKKFIPATQA